MNCRYHPAAVLIRKTVKAPAFFQHSIEQMGIAHRKRIILCCPVEGCAVVAMESADPDWNDTCEHCGKKNVLTPTEAEFMTNNIRNRCKACKKLLQVKRSQRFKHMEATA